jgi:hypothetical protein
MILPFLSTYWGAGIWAKTCDNVPISALRQNFQNEKYIRTLIAFASLLLGRNLHPLTESVNRRVQEEVDSAN